MNEENFLYCLLLENNKYYVGISKDVEKRLKKHFKGKGSRFTRENKPVEVLFTQSLGDAEMDDYLIMETQATINLMSLVGCHCVRGGSFIYVDTDYQFYHWKNTLKNNKAGYEFPKIWLDYSYSDFLKSIPTKNISFKKILKIKF